MVLYFQEQQHTRVALQSLLWYIMQIEVMSTSFYVQKECLKSLKQGITA